MAALSAHSRGDGTRSGMPRDAHTAVSRARSSRLHATPPPRVSARARQASSARTVFATSVSTTAAWKDAATSASSASG